MEHHQNLTQKQIHLVANKVNDFYYQIMNVPYNYLPMQFKNSNKIISEWKKLIKTSDFTLGKFITNFEKKLFFNV